MDTKSGGNTPEQSLTKSKRKRLRKKSIKQQPQEDGGEAQACILEAQKLEKPIRGEVSQILLLKDSQQQTTPLLEKINPIETEDTKSNILGKIFKKKSLSPTPKTEHAPPPACNKPEETLATENQPLEAPTEVKMADAAEKSREEIMAARKAKKASKKVKEDKPKEKKEQVKPVKPEAEKVVVAPKPEKSAEVKEAVENKENKQVETAQAPQKSSKELKEERRQKQEAQRAAKAAALAAKAEVSEAPAKGPAAVSKEPVKKVIKQNKQVLHGLARTVSAVKREETHSEIDESEIHPSFVQLGAQLHNRVVRGSTARVVALMRALKHLINDYKTPEHLELRRHLADLVQQHMDYLDRQRPNSVSMVQAVRSLRINSLPYGTTEQEAKDALIKATDMFLEKLEQDAQSVALNLADKMAQGDTVLVYSYSSLLLSVLAEHYTEDPTFQVVVVGSITHNDGLKMLRSLMEVGIECTYILVNQVNFIISQVQLVLLGAESMSANSSMIGRAGSAQIATVAKAQGVPVYACCETCNFSYQSHLSPFYKENEAEPDCIAPRLKKVTNLSQCSLLYDVVPERLLTAIITEVSVLPCSSVPVVLHMQSSDTVLKRRIKT